MDTLKTIQTIAKIGKILSKIAFIFCIVGVCGCAAGICSFAIGAPTLKLGGVTLESFLQTNADASAGTIYANLAASAVTCAGGIILAKFAMRYLERELKDGTPFTADGANELQRLGILTICIPLGAQILAQIVTAIIAKAFADVVKPETDNDSAVIIGVMLIILAQICKYGAALSQEKRSDAQTDNTIE